MKSAVDYYFDLGDRLAKEKAQNLANQRASIFNQLYPESIESNISQQRANQRLREAQTLREQMFSQHPELLAGREGQQEFLRQHFGPDSDIGRQIQREREMSLMPRSSSDPLAKQHALLNVVRTTPHDSPENRLARAELNNMAATRTAPSISVGGSTVTLGGAQPADIFGERVAQPTSDVQVGTAAAPMARGRAGITLTRGQDVHSIPSSTQLSSLQKRALALQSIFKDLPQLSEAARYSAGFGLGRGEELGSSLVANLFPESKIAKNYRNYQNSQAVLAKIIDGLSSFLNIPRTNEGLQMIARYIGPHTGDTREAYKSRLENLIFPSLMKNYNQIQESLTKGIPINLKNSFSEEKSPEVRVRNIRTGRTGRVERKNLDRVLSHGDWVVSHE